MGKRLYEDIQTLQAIRHKWLDLARSLEHQQDGLLVATTYRHCAADLYWVIVEMSSHG